MRGDQAPIPGIQVLFFDSIEDLALRLPAATRYFTLLLAWDAPSLPEGDLEERLRPLVNRGLVYFCAWGDRCEEVHDAVDRCDIERMRVPGSEGYVIMTTWHAKDTLEKAFWFFSDLALPGDERMLGDMARYAVTIGNRNWGKRLKQLLREG